jgi:hypothetical protein
MSVELHRPPKPEESPKNSKFFNGKNHTLPGIRLHNWVGDKENIGYMYILLKYFFQLVKKVKYYCMTLDGESSTPFVILPNLVTLTETR